MHAIKCWNNDFISYLFGIWPRRRGWQTRLKRRPHDYKEMEADMRALALLGGARYRGQWSQSDMAPSMGEPDAPHK